MLTICYNERIQAKFNMGKRHMGQNSGENKHKLPGVFSPWSSRDPSNSPGKDAHKINRKYKDEKDQNLPLLTVISVKQ